MEPKRRSLGNLTFHLLRFHNGSPALLCRMLTQQFDCFTGSRSRILKQKAPKMLEHLRSGDPNERQSVKNTKHQVGKDVSGKARRAQGQSLLTRVGLSKPTVRELRLIGKEVSRGLKQTTKAELKAIAKAYGYTTAQVIEILALFAIAEAQRNALEQGRAE